VLASAWLLMSIVASVGQIECYNLSSRARLSYEATFVNPTGISVFDSRVYVSDSARETVSSVALDLSSERVMQHNVQQLGVLKVYSTRLNGICTVAFFRLIISDFSHKNVLNLTCRQLAYDKKTLWARI